MAHDYLAEQVLVACVDFVPIHGRAPDRRVSCHMGIGRENDGLGSLDTAADLGGDETPFKIKGQINESSSRVLRNLRKY